MGGSDAIASFLERRLPRALLRVFALYSGWLEHWRERRKAWSSLKPLRNVGLLLLFNAVIITAVFIAAALAAARLPETLHFLSDRFGGARPVFWLAAMLVCLPLYVVTFRKLEVLGMMIADIVVPLHEAGPRTGLVRALVTHAIHVGGLILLALLTAAMSAVVLPGWYMFAISLGLAIILGLVFRSTFGRWYNRARFALLETWTRRRR